MGHHIRCGGGPTDTETYRVLAQDPTPEND